MTAAELVLVALCAEEDALKGVNADLLSICDSAVYRGFAPAIVDEHRVVDLSVNVVLQPLGLRGVKAAVGVIPLGIEAGFRQLSHKGLKVFIIALFLVQEVAVKAHVFRHLDQFLRNGEVPVFIPLDQVRASLAGAESRIEIDTGNGHNAVLVGGVGVSRVRDVDDTELKASGLPVAGDGVINGLRGIRGSRAVPGGEIVGVLPEIQHMLAELIGIHGAVKEAVAVVTLHQHYLSIRGQIGLCLGSLEGFVALLQRHFCPQELCIGIGFRAPIFNVLYTIAGKGRLRRGLVVRPRISCKGG